MFKSIKEFVTKIKINPTMIVEIWGSNDPHGKNSRPRIYELPELTLSGNAAYSENYVETNIKSFMNFIINEYGGPRYGGSSYHSNRFIHKIYVIKLKYMKLR